MKFSQVPQSGGKAPRAMRACEKFSRSAEKLGSNATAANQRQGNPEGDEDELDDAAAHDLPGD